MIYSNLMCFSDSVWKERPGSAPLAEDITDISVRTFFDSDSFEELEQEIK